MASVFFSYSHKDEVLRDQLETHLAALKRQGFIEAWHDRRLLAGDDVHEQISAHLEAADVILLLVSPDFLASDYCYEKEMARAMERQRAGEATVIPVILRPCDWQSVPFSQLRAVPKDGKAITLWPNIDEAFLDVTTAIKAALKEHKTSSRIPTPPSSLGPGSGAVNPVPDLRSSNLRVAKTFTEREKDQFLHDAFEYVAKFFEGSLQELERRYPEIQGSVRRIDANRFTAVAYRSGQAVARCTVFLGGLSRSSGAISYSPNDSGETNSYNESLSVAADEQSLFFRSLGMGYAGRGAGREMLSVQGGAELLWGMFMEPLQRQ